MRARLTGFSLALAIAASLGCNPIGCDPGSSVSRAPVGATQCKITLESKSSGFVVEMLLSCSGDAHTRCYTIDALTCDGESIPLEQPQAIERCPAIKAGAWTIATKA